MGREMMKMSFIVTSRRSRVLLFMFILVISVLGILGVPAVLMKSNSMGAVPSFQAILGKENPPSTENTIPNNHINIENTDMEAGQKSNIEDTVHIDKKEETTEDESYATSHKKEALTEDIIKLSDVYAAALDSVHLRCYYPDAVSYQWEKYDMQRKRWEELPEENVPDELNRTVSGVELTAPGTKGEYIMVRCSTDFADGESTTEIASVYSIGDKNNIAGISVDGEYTEYTTNSCEWVSIYDIPVTVVFSDGAIEQITGLDGLAFVEKQESREIAYNDAGNAVETLTTISTECKYSYIGVEEKETVLRYRIDNDRMYETNILVSGKDILPPEITSVDISAFEIKTVDEPITVTVSIMAEDNTTPYPFLQYAFLPEGTEPAENDWMSKYSFEKDIDQNGTWIAYCKDQSGNISTLEKDIIAVDQKPPVVKISISNNGWCKSNRIIVEAKDALPVTYFYSCYETGEESGWTERTEYDVTQNGTWKVQAKDAAGNITAKDITIGNIDTQMPIIKGITKTKGGCYDKEK